MSQQTIQQPGLIELDLIDDNTTVVEKRATLEPDKLTLEDDTMGVTVVLDSTMNLTDIQLVSVVSDGTSGRLQANVTFPHSYLGKPAVSFADIVQAVGYVDVMCAPFVTNVSSTGCVVVFNTARAGDLFAAGTLMFNIKITGQKA